MYILNSYGAFPDPFYILPIASWSASSRHGAQYGLLRPVRPHCHRPLESTWSISTIWAAPPSGTVGTYATSGFFVYDPNYSATPANNLQHVVGYNSGGVPPTAFNVGTLLSNGAGKLVLVNNNPVASTTNLGMPITILNTTAPQTLFFTNTTKPYSYNNDVDITPGAELSTISAASLYYTAIGGADINAASNVAYVFAYNSTSLTTPGLLLEYNLAPAPPHRKPCSAAALRCRASIAPWRLGAEMNYNPESTELALSVSLYGSAPWASHRKCAPDRLSR